MTSLHDYNLPLAIMRTGINILVLSSSTKGLFQKLENSNYTPIAKNSPVIEEVLRNTLIKK